MKVKKERAGLHWNIKKTKNMATEEIHNFNIDNEDTEGVKDFAYLSAIINSNRDFSQKCKRRLSLRRAVIEELGKITKSKNVSLETKAKIIIYSLLLGMDGKVEQKSI